MSSTEDPRDKIRRSISHEFVRLEDTFDETAKHRETLTNKLMSAIENIKLVDENGNVKEDTDTGTRLISTALKALGDSEKSVAQGILLKLKNQEQEIASNNAAKERIEIVLRATAPGRIQESFPSDELDKALTEMFEDDIRDSELKTNSKDLNDS